ncbi:MAG: hypothetical protein GVY13_14685 [Alphaproteobacteria bacterium]|jgi:plasmid stability protein|nr:hypothetical protein [Alphaproteobacteria bacterium]
MAALTLPDVDDEIVRALEQRAAAHGRSAEAEHREIPRTALLPEDQTFALRAKALRQRLPPTTDSTDTIRADRDEGAG